MSNKVASGFEELPNITPELLTISDSVHFQKDNLALRINDKLYHFIKAYTSDEVTVYIDDNRIGKFYRMLWITEECFIYVVLTSEDVELTLRFEVEGF